MNCHQIMAEWHKVEDQMARLDHLLVGHESSSQRTVFITPLGVSGFRSNPYREEKKRLDELQFRADTLRGLRKIKGCKQSN